MALERLNALNNSKSLHQSLEGNAGVPNNNGTGVIWEGYSKTTSNPSSVSSAASQSEDAKAISEYITILISAANSDTKLPKIFEKYFSSDSQYQKLSNEEKKNFINQKIAELTQLFNPDGKELSKEGKKILSIKIVALLATSKANNISLNDLSAMDSEKRSQLLSQTVSSYIHKLIDIIPDFDKKSASEQVYAIADVLLKYTDEDYNKLSDVDKKETCKQKTNDFFARMLGMDAKKFDIEKFTAKFPHFDPAELLKYCSEKNVDFEKIMNSSSLNRMKFFAGYLASKKSDLSEEEQKQLTFLQAKLDLIQQCPNPDNAKEIDIYNVLLNKQKNGEKLSKEEQIILKEYNFIQNSKNLTQEQKDKIFNSEAGIESNFVINKVLGSEEGALELRFGEIEDVKSKEFKQAAENYIKGANGDRDAEQIDKLKNYLVQNRGMSEQEAIEFIQSLDEKPNYGIMQADAMANHNPKKASSAQKIGATYGNEEDKQIVRAMTQETVREFTEEENKEYGISSVQNGFGEDFSRGLNLYKPQDEASRTAKYVLSSDEIDDNQKRTFAKDMVTTTDDDSRKLYYAEELSTVDNPAVAQGLLDGVSTVNNETVKEQYVQTVQTSVSAQSIKSEVSVISSYASKTNEKDATKAYISYLSDVTKQLENKRDAVGEKIKQVQTDIEESQKSREEKELEKLYKGLTENTVKQIKNAFKTAGAAGVYEKLGNLQMVEAQKAFLIYFIQNSNTAEIKNFASKFSGDPEVLQAICTYGNVNDLPADLIVKCIEKGWISISNISDLNGILNENKNNLPFLRRMFDATRNISILALNFDLLSEYINLGKINLALLPPTLYQRYKNSLTPIRQQMLDEKLEQDKLTLKFEEDPTKVDSKNTDTPNPTQATAAQQASTPIPGSPEFYAALNRQSEKYNPNSYFTGTTYDPKRIKKLNRKG